MPKQEIQRKVPVKQVAKRRRIWPFLLAGSLGLILLLIVLVPRLLVGEATQKPAEAGTFVTRTTETTSLQEKMQQSLGQGQNPPPQPGQVNIQPGTTGQTSAVTPSEPPLQQAPEAPSTGGQEAPQNPPANVSEPGQTGQDQPGSVNMQTAAPPAADSGSFHVSLSEGEISSLIYSGLSERTAPEYRQSIQGVSTRISGGRATITVALLPKYLPDAFLRNLPGVTRDTPTVYLGGEIGLHRAGDSVGADIYHLSLGNLQVPMPFIRDAVAATVQQQAAQMLKLPNGQQAHLDDVVLDSGALTLQGHV